MIHDYVRVINFLLLLLIIIIMCNLQTDTVLLRIRYSFIFKLTSTILSTV